MKTTGDIDASEVRALAKSLGLVLDEAGVTAAMTAMASGGVARPSDSEGAESRQEQDEEEVKSVSMEQFGAWYSQQAGGPLSAAAVGRGLHIKRHGSVVGDALAAFLALNYGTLTLSIYMYVQERPQRRYLAAAAQPTKSSGSNRTRESNALVLNCMAGGGRVM